MSKVSGWVILLAVLGAFGAVGCNFQKALHYKDMTAAMTYSGSGAVAVGVLDHRPDVADGKRKPSFEGIMRSSVGIPWSQDISGVLAGEMGQAIVTTLQRRGFRPVPVTLSPTDALDGAQKRVGKAANDGVGVLLVINQWAYDGYNSYDLQYDLVLHVIDPDGNVLASAPVQGQENLGTNPIRGAKPAFQSKLNMMFADGKVSDAIQGGGEPEPADDPPPRDVPSDDKKSIEGESCTKSADCSGELRCVEEVCTAPAATACTKSSECPGELRCIDKVCKKAE